MTGIRLIGVLQLILCPIIQLTSNQLQILGDQPTKLEGKRRLFILRSLLNGRVMRLCADRFFSVSRGFSAMSMYGACDRPTTCEVLGKPSAYPQRL